MQYFSQHKLLVNVEKSKLIVFKYRKSFQFEGDIYMNTVKMKKCSQCEYLGILFDENNDLEGDIKRCTSRFLSQFHGILYHFNKTSDLEMMSFLFKSYCFSFYGLETWHEATINTAKLKKIAVAYHEAIMRICGLMIWDSNHVAR